MRKLQLHCQPSTSLAVIFSDRYAPLVVCLHFEIMHVLNWKNMRRSPVNTWVFGNKNYHKDSG